jgi:hypothetical protein
MKANMLSIGAHNKQCSEIQTPCPFISATALNFPGNDILQHKNDAH